MYNKNGFFSMISDGLLQYIYNTTNKYDTEMENRSILLRLREGKVSKTLFLFKRFK